MTDIARKAQMKEMYERGKTYADIGREFGVSRQRVYQLIGGEYKSNPRFIDTTTCVYGSIRDFLNTNRMSIAEYAREIYGNNNPGWYRKTLKILKGQYDARKSFIDRTLEITGLTYEEAFRKEDVL